MASRTRRTSLAWAVAARSARRAIEQEAHSRWYFLLAGLGLLFWFSMGAVRALRVAHFVARRKRPEKLRRPLAACGLFTLIVTGLLAASVGTSWLRDQTGSAGVLATLLLVVLHAGAALGIFGLLPHGEAHWTALIPGALLVGVGVQVIHLTVVLYLVPKLGRSTELYGSLGAATVILLWLYFSARLIVAAAFLNASLWEHRRAPAP